MRRLSIEELQTLWEGWKREEEDKKREGGREEVWKGGREGGWVGGRGEDRRRREGEEERERRSEERREIVEYDTG